MKIVVIMPTYNERENIGKMIPILMNEIFPNMQEDMHLLVVDDNSPDGTKEVVIQLQKEYPTLNLITGQKQGLGSAYIRGMTHAMEELKADAIMEMDADFSHDPSDIPRLIDELKNHDFVIGSRYVPGGQIPPEWTLYRQMNSKFGNVAARHIAGMSSVKDCTAGFRAIRTDLLKRIALTKFNVQGYCFQINLLHEALVHNADVKEVPVVFIDRTVGESKLGMKDIVEFLWAVWVIRLQSSKTFIRFGIVGLSGLFVNLGIMTMLLGINMNKFIASPISIEVSIVTNFLLNNFWTFGQRETDSHISIRGLKFNLVSLLALGLSYGTFVAISYALPDTMPQIAQAIGIAPATAINYFLNSYWTFKENKEKSYSKEKKIKVQN